MLLDLGHATVALMRGLLEVFPCADHGFCILGFLLEDVRAGETSVHR